MKRVRSLAALDVPSPDGNLSRVHWPQSCTRAEVVHLARRKQWVGTRHGESIQGGSGRGRARGFVSHARPFVGVLCFAIEVQGFGKLVGQKCSRVVASVGSLEVLIRGRVKEILRRNERAECMAVCRVECQRIAASRHELPRSRGPVQQALVRGAGLNQCATAVIPARARNRLRVPITRVRGDVPLTSKHILAKYGGDVHGSTIIDSAGGRIESTGALDALQRPVVVAAPVDASFYIEFESREVSV